MYRLVFLFLLALPAFLSGQNSNRLLIYADGYEYGLPYIEKTLTNLIDRRTSSEMFLNVSYLNRIARSIATENMLRETINYYTNKDFALDTRTKIIQQEIGKILTGYDLFLEIKILPLQSLLEYQFTLYQVVNDSIKDGSIFPSNNTISPISSTSFFLDPGKQNFENNLEFAIKRLFSESNFKPVAKISYNNKIVTGALFFSVGDTIEFNGNFSIDKDSRSENLNFFWRQISFNEDTVIGDANRLAISNGSSKVFVLAIQEGTYKVGLRVSDNIEYSDEDTVIFSVVKRKKIWIPNKQIYLTRQVALFGREYQYLKGYIPIITTDFDTINKNQIQYAINGKINDSLHAMYEYHLVKIRLMAESVKKMPEISMDEFLKIPHIFEIDDCLKAEEGIYLLYSYLNSYGKSWISLAIKEGEYFSNTDSFKINNRVYRSVSIDASLHNHALNFVNGQDTTSLVEQSLDFGIDFQLFRRLHLIPRLEIPYNTYANIPSNSSSIKPNYFTWPRFSLTLFYDITTNIDRFGNIICFQAGLNFRKFYTQKCFEKSPGHCSVESEVKSNLLSVESRIKIQPFFKLDIPLTINLGGEGAIKKSNKDMFSYFAVHFGISYMPKYRIGKSLSYKKRQVVLGRPVY